jgi:hypothetical protein
MQYNSDLRAQLAIIGHAIFTGNAMTHYIRPGIDELSQMFADWRSGAAIFTRTGPEGRRQVLAISLYRMASNSDQDRAAKLLQADFADNPTTQSLSELPGVSLSMLAFDSHAVPIPLLGKVAETIYAQLYHQFHDGSNN